MRELKELAQELPEDKVTQQGAHQGHWHAEHAQQHVRDGQIEEENIGDGAHPTILNQSGYNQEVAQDGEEQDESVAGDQPNGHARRCRVSRS